jgi:hypothetical protein
VVAGRPLAFGVLLGLATAAKLYPVLLLGPLFVLCWRAGKMAGVRDGPARAGGSWLVVNLPVMLLAPEGWSKFYTFSQERGVDFGSFWLILSQRMETPLDTDTVNTFATVLVLLCLRGHRGALADCPAPAALRPAGLPDRRGLHPHQQGLLAAVRAVAGAAGRAGPAEVAGLPDLAGVRGGVLPGIWMYLAYTTSGDAHKGLPQEGYQLAIAVHLLGTLYLCAVIVRDILMPERDVVRRTG